MISFSPQVPIYLVHKTVGFNRGIDGMCRICLELLERDPMERGYFLFLSKSRKQLRILWYDGQGFSLCTKRLSQGRFKNWPDDPRLSYKVLEFFEANSIIAGARIDHTHFENIWKKVS